MGRTIKLANDTYFDPTAILFVKDFPNDLNDCITNGVYPYRPSTLNRPNTIVEYGIVIVINCVSEGWIYQIAIGNWDSPGISVRCSVNNTWAEWRY